MVGPCLGCIGCTNKKKEPDEFSFTVKTSEMTLPTLTNHILYILCINIIWINRFIHDARWFNSVLGIIIA
ncbi:hypothetical protein DERP_001590 [Dermatophagoides pteronyssinus]|uniref:Uncharacterized protein n=1 Tax=Dermatophagoides pteronyssinus TaxID=6956 RepID=A0ABQ8JAY1_DERPT|nr:hypothetical protein DERP_001590 [Dermatophagoides pteronyssinus]